MLKIKIPTNKEKLNALFFGELYIDASQIPEDTVLEEVEINGNQSMITFSSKSGFENAAPQIKKVAPKEIELMAFLSIALPAYSYMMNEMRRQKPELDDKDYQFCLQSIVSKFMSGELFE